MTRFIGFVKKEFFHIWRDKRTLLILFGMPVVQILLFGFAITNEIRNAPIAVLDNSKDDMSRRLINKMLSTGYYLLVENLENYSQIDQVFKEGRVKQVVVIEPDFGKNLNRYGKAGVQLIADASDPNTGNTIINYSTAIIRDFQREINSTLVMPLNISTEARMHYNENLKGVYLFIPGLITIVLMLVSAMMTSISLTREKELGTMEVLLASPMKPAHVIIAKVIPYMLLSFINALVILALGFFVFEVPIRGSIGLLLLESLLFIITALSLGILISTRSNTQQVALMISLFALMLPTVILSGFIFPLENMPVPLQYLANIIPAKWFIIIVKGIMLKGSGLEGVWKETLVLCGFTLFFIGSSIKNYKVRLE